VRIGVLCSRIRAEEKLLFEGFARRRLEIEKIDDRELVFDLAAQPPRYDVVLERCLHHSRALYSLRILNQWGIRSVNTYEVALTCGDKSARSAYLERMDRTIRFARSTGPGYTTRRHYCRRVRRVPKAGR